MTERKTWGIYIDIEGFGCKYKGNMVSVHYLNALMECIFKIGTQKYCNDQERLFANQLGDAFFITNDNYEANIDRPVAIAIVLMRYVLAAGGVAKATIAQGDFMDIKGLYPQVVKDNEDCYGRIKLGNGLMTLVSNMGTALINAVGLEKKAPSGSLLVISAKDKSLLSPDFIHYDIENDLTSINWLKGEHSLVTEIMKDSGIPNIDEDKRIELLQKYYKSNTLKEDWTNNTNLYLNIPS